MVYILIIIGIYTYKHRVSMLITSGETSSDDRIEREFLRFTILNGNIFLSYCYVDMFLARRYVEKWAKLGDPQPTKPSISFIKEYESAYHKTKTIKITRPVMMSQLLPVTFIRKMIIVLKN